MKRIFVTGLAVLLLAGCSGGGRKIVPVSGMVRVNGQPYPNAIVTFQPIAADKDENPGRGSSAKTGPDGRFTLVCDGQKGAFTGRHRVRISTDVVSEPTPKEGFDSDPNWKPGRMVEIIPPEWHDLSKHEFEVPSGGTDQANFDIETKTPPK